MNRVAGTLLLLTGLHAAHAGTVTLHPSPQAPKIDRTRLLGTNLALWHEPEQLEHPAVKTALRALRPAFLRLPGGSWSDEVYWNGHGVRQGGSFDRSKRGPDGRWQVDYSGYSPGFRLDNVQGDLSDYHGAVDVRALHEYVRDEGALAVVTVNAGTGSPEMAAEWVRWANLQQHYGVRYWEVGNELEGAWEMGHIGTDGSRMTGSGYARKFAQFAEAMKAVDPGIRVGGPAASNLSGGFAEDLLKLGGEHVDFLSVHTYPVGNALGGEEAFFAAIEQLAPAVERLRAWIRQYVPERADAIELAITEWNSTVYEGRDTGDLLNGLWTAVWIGEMFRTGVSFAIHWDALTRTATGGHGLFARQGDTWVPTAQYWAMFLWSRHMGDQWVPSTWSGETGLYAFATREGTSLRLMLVNRTRDREIPVLLDPGGLTPAGDGIRTRLAHHDYFWDPIRHQPLRSRPPRSDPFTYQPGTAILIPPFSVEVLELPLAGSAPLPASFPPPVLPAPSTLLLLPAHAPADLPIEGWIVVDGPDRDAFPRTLPLHIQGAATSDVSQVRVREGAGRFFVHATGPGPITVSTTGARATVDVVPVEPRDEILWPFETPAEQWGLRSDFALTSDDNSRPNQRVAAVRLHNDKPAQHHDGLLIAESLPEGLDKSRIHGVRVDLRVEPGLVCPDPETRLSVVLQSAGDHWIVLGHIPLREVGDDWRSHRFSLPTPEHTQVMGGCYALRLQISQPSPLKSPVTGTVHLDNLGFILR